MVIDTSVFIEHLRARNRTATTLANLPVKTVIYVSAVTVFELFSGATDPNKTQDVRTLLSDVIVLPFTAEIGERAGEIFRQLRQNGMMIEATDILIAATAIAQNLPVKTLNINHFNRIPGLALA